MAWLTVDYDGIEYFRVPGPLKLTKAAKIALFFDYKTVSLKNPEDSYIAISRVNQLARLINVPVFDFDDETDCKRCGVFVKFCLARK